MSEVVNGARVLARALFGGTAPAEADGPPSVDDARRALRRAQLDLRAAEYSHQQAVAATNRVRAVIDDADAKEREARAAEAAASESTRAWAAAGAPDAAARGDTVMYRRATAARHAAERARLMADGAEEGLPAAESAQVDAELARDAAASAVGSAVATVIAVEVEPAVRRLEAARAEYDAALAEVAPLARYARGVFGYNPPKVAIPEVRDRVTAATRFPAQRPEDVPPGTLGWARYAKRLSLDADATRDAEGDV